MEKDDNKNIMDENSVKHQEDEKKEDDFGNIPDISPTSDFPMPSDSDMPHSSSSVTSVVSGRDKSKSKVVVMVGVSIFGVAIVAAIAYYFLVVNRPKEEPETTLTPAPEATTPANTTSGFQVDDRATYTDPGRHITFKYPRDLSIIESPDNEIIITKLGPTQKEGTEFYDGISLTIVASSIGDKSLKEIVDEKVALGKASSSVIVGDSEIYTLGSITGYKYDSGEDATKIENIFLPLGPDSYVRVVNSSRDPGELGYQEIVDKIIESIEFLPPATSE